MTAVRFFALAVALAVLLAPLGMMRGGQAHASPMTGAASEMVDHCTGQPEDADDDAPCGAADCIASCAMMAADPGERTNAPHALVAGPKPDAVPLRLGRESEFEPPPPRSS